MTLSKLKRTLDWTRLSYHEKRYVLCHGVLPKRIRIEREQMTRFVHDFASTLQVRFDTAYGPVQLWNWNVWWTPTEPNL